MNRTALLLVAAITALAVGAALSFIELIVLGVALAVAAAVVALRGRSATSARSDG
ncbi:MAG TPA: hypothetical protein VHB30_06430 [Solirubrobacteraceae bacterium]|jgi:hypothetical protein|nr:hypothetical protein [Solirubrobacteraceae bacterium]